MNKIGLLIELEHEFLSHMINNERLVSVIFQKISLDMISDNNKELFESILRLEDKSSEAIIWEVKKFSSDLLISINEILPQNIEFAIRKFFDVYYSIQQDKLLKETYELNVDKLNGFNTLFELKESIERLLDKSNRFETVRSFAECLTDLPERLERQKIKSDSLVSDLYPSFTSATGGLNLGNLVSIAGAYKNGKTSFGLNLINDFAQQGIATAIFSLEMSKEEIEYKLLSMRTGIDYELIRNPKKLTPEDCNKINNYAENSNRNEKLFIFDKSFTIPEIESNCKILKDKHNLKVILIDYIGLIKHNHKSKNESREREVSATSNAMKILAKELDLVVIMLSQLNRSGLNDPSSINLAESIGLARDSDFLFTIYNAKDYGVHKINDGSNIIEVTDKNFVVKLDSSRHSKKGKEFLVDMNNSGLMKEISTQYDNKYLLSKVS